MSKEQIIRNIQSVDKKLHIVIKQNNVQNMYVV